MRLPSEILDLVLSYHRNVCAEAFAGNPNYTLFWAYDKLALKALIGLSYEKYNLIKSKLGPFMKRNPATAKWIASMPWIGDTPPAPIIVPNRISRLLFYQLHHKSPKS